MVWDHAGRTYLRTLPERRTVVELVPTAEPEAKAEAKPSMWTRLKGLDQNGSNKLFDFSAEGKAGATADIIARIYADELGKALGQNIVVDNKTGAGGTIATAEAARAAPDGYTMILVSQGTVVFNIGLYKTPGYDPLKDLAPISQVAELEFALSTGPMTNAATLKDAVAWLEAQAPKTAAFNGFNLLVGDGRSLFYFGSREGDVRATGVDEQQVAGAEGHADGVGVHEPAQLLEGLGGLGVGIGVDYGIYIFARLQTSLNAGEYFEDAMFVALKEAGADAARATATAPEAQALRRRRGRAAQPARTRIGRSTSRSDSSDRVSTARTVVAATRPRGARGQSSSTVICTGHDHR